MTKSALGQKRTLKSPLESGHSIIHSILGFFPPIPNNRLHRPPLGETAARSRRPLPARPVSGSSRAACSASDGPVGPTQHIIWSTGVAGWRPGRRSTCRTSSALRPVRLDLDLRRGRRNQFAHSDGLSSRRPRPARRRLASRWVSSALTTPRRFVDASSSARELLTTWSSVVRRARSPRARSGPR